MMSNSKKRGWGCRTRIISQAEDRPLKNGPLMCSNIIKLGLETVMWES